MSHPTLFNRWHVPGRRRSWLHPRWYVTHIGPSLVAGSPWPGSGLQAVEPGTPDPTCSVCGIPCDAGGFDLPVGYMCIEHGRQWHDENPAPRPTLLQRLWEPLDSRLDDTYWWYACRFGKRVVR